MIYYLGLIPPTSGEAYINGWDIAKEMDQIRSSLLLGVCPQSNVLWDTFTVEEHLYIHCGIPFCSPFSTSYSFYLPSVYLVSFTAVIHSIYAGLKGIEHHEIKETLDSMIKDLDLEEKRHTRSAALSGGQKRKLQLAIAFVGYNKVIFLGM